MFESLNIPMILAQILGGLGILIYVIMYHSKEVNNVLHKKFWMDILWASHYFLIGGYAGCATNVVCCAREVVFMNNDKKVFQSKAWLILFLVINWIAAFLTWKGVYSILPATVSTLGTFSFWQKNMKVARIIAMINNVLMFTYDVMVLSYMGMVGEALVFFSVISALVMEKYRSGADRTRVA